MAISILRDVGPTLSETTRNQLAIYNFNSLYQAYPLLRTLIRETYHKKLEDMSSDDEYEISQATLIGDPEMEDNLKIDIILRY